MVIKLLKKNIGHLQKLLQGLWLNKDRISNKACVARLYNQSCHVG